MSTLTMSKNTNSVKNGRNQASFGLFYFKPTLKDFSGEWSTHVDKVQITVPIGMNFFAWVYCEIKGSI